MRPSYTIKVWKWRWEGGFGGGSAPYYFNQGTAARDLVAVWDDATFDGFEMNINGGVGECVFHLARPFDDFGEGEDVKLYNMVEIISHDRHSPPGGRTIYTGYISKYAPYVHGSNEGVDVTCLGYQTTLKVQTYHFNHGDYAATTQEHLLYEISGENPADLIKYMVDGHTFEADRILESVDVFSPISYTTNSIEDSNDTVTVEVSYPTKYEMLEWCVDISSNIDYWYMDGRAVINYKEYNDEEDHTFTFGKDFKDIDLEKSLENTFNKTVMSNRRQWNDENFAALGFPDDLHTQLGSQYLEEGYIREELIEDQTIKTSNQLLDKGDKRNDIVSEPTKSVEFNISGDVYDIDSIEPGDTCRVLGLPKTIEGIDVNNLTIKKVSYMKDYVKLQVATKQEQLRSQITDKDPTRNLKVVGREDIPKKLYYDIT